jgi:hypothetical protein
MQERGVDGYSGIAQDNNQERHSDTSNVLARHWPVVLFVDTVLQISVVCAPSKAGGSFGALDLDLHNIPDHNQQLCTHQRCRPAMACCNAQWQGPAP